MEDFLHINLGNIITIAAYFIGGVAFVLAIKKDVAMLGQKSDLQHMQNKEKFDNLGDKVEKLGELVVTSAKHEMRLDSIERQLRERHQS